MQPVTNFLLASRVDTPSAFERTGDLLLTPARVLFGGKRVFVLQNNLMQVGEQQVGPLSSNRVLRGARKVLAFIQLPLAAVGFLVKLICLKEQSYRAFCVQKISQNPTCHPKLFEMFEHVHSTARFVLDLTRRFGVLVFTPLNLYECSCMETREFHRFHSPRRNNLENAIVQRLADSRLDKSQPIQLLSMGSGGLMSDFLTLEKLVLEGFKKIAIDCVDPIGIDAGRVERIRKFFAKYPEASIEIQAYKNIDEVPAEKIGYSAVLAVDYDSLFTFDFNKRLTCTGDLMKAYRRLSVSGFLGLGFSKEDTLSGPQMATIELSPRRSVVHSLASDLTQQLPQKEELTVGLPSLQFAGASHSLILALAFAVEKSSRPYRKISLTCLKRRGEDGAPHFQAMMQVLFPATYVEISFHDQQNKKCDLLFTGSLENEFISKEYLSFLNSQSITYIVYPKGEIFRQNNDREDQRLEIR
ncbi:hypothetical protein [Parachlamydia sp. AcF125]|uniref:hypothetical protein n=1 Tax=Parachlamydia sp. AcF125 TaxID=2795736 RepID=UPI001BC9845E|nr:hypothetical protein [Parachlamydia sp. AcF125]MBS4168727.1 hypothetical protein [Parachlamydia sp. AcF125]